MYFTNHFLFSLFSSFVYFHHDTFTRLLLFHRSILTSCHTSTSDVIVETKAGEAETDPLGCGSLYLVFDYVEHDLAGLIDIKYRFPAKAIKYIAKQLFEALLFLHERRIIHRVILILFYNSRVNCIYVHLRPKCVFASLHFLCICLSMLGYQKLQHLNNK